MRMSEMLKGNDAGYVESLVSGLSIFLWSNTVLVGVCLWLGVGENGSRVQEVQENQKTLSLP